MMSANLRTTSTDDLRQMSYSELKKMAKENGLKGNLKASKIITILSKQHDGNVQIISTPVQHVADFKKAKIEDELDDEMLIPQETPRRGTFTVTTTPNQNLNLSTAVEPSGSLHMDLSDSNVTLFRGSSRKAQSRNADFSNSLRKSKRISLKNKHKSPVITQTPVAKKVLFSSPSDSLRKMSSGVSYRTTPHPKMKPVSTSVKKLDSKNLPANKLKPKATPNFKKIHQKAFEKMESIDDYQKRKIEYSSKKLQLSKIPKTKEKSKIPVPFTGIPFVPTAIKSTAKQYLNFAKTMSENKKIHNAQIKCENENKSKMKFDLKASLSRKLRYKPYTGRLKPLSESNATSSSIVSCVHKPRNTVKKGVENNRSQVRTALQGVRTNKRFELQMKNRILV